MGTASIDINDIILDMNTPNWNDLAIDLLKRVGDETQNAIPLLQAIQREQGYIPVQLVEAIASRSDHLAANQLYGVATFYSQFTFTPKGRHTIRVCVGTACHVKGAERILGTLSDKLGLSEGERTTKDMLFTTETVSCLGACVLAPVIVVDEKVQGQVTSEKIAATVNKIVAEESQQHVSA